MTRITLDEPLKSQLDDLVGPVEFCDQSGRVMGRYIPAFEAAVRETSETLQVIEHFGG